MSDPTAPLRRIASPEWQLEVEKYVAAAEKNSSAVDSFYRRLKVDASVAIRSSGAGFNEQRILRPASFLSLGVKIHDSISTDWIDTGEFRTVLDGGMRWYTRLIERRERDGRKRLGVPLNLTSAALAQEDKRPTSSTLSIERGYGSESFGQPFFLTDSVSLDTLEFDTGMTLQEGITFAGALNEFSAVALKEQQTAASAGSTQ